MGPAKKKKKVDAWWFWRDPTMPRFILLVLSEQKWQDKTDFLKFPFPFWKSATRGVQKGHL